MSWQLAQFALVSAGASVLIPLATNGIMPWWSAALIIGWAFSIGLVAFIQGWESRGQQ